MLLMRRVGLDGKGTATRAGRFVLLFSYVVPVVVYLDVLNFGGIPAYVPTIRAHVRFAYLCS